MQRSAGYPNQSSMYRSYSCSTTLDCIPLEELQQFSNTLISYSLPTQQCSIRSLASQRRFAFLQGKIEPVRIVGHPPPHYAPQDYVSPLPTTRSKSSRDPPPLSYHPAQPSSSSSQIRRNPTLSEPPNFTVPPPLQYAPNSYSSSTSDGSNSTSTAQPQRHPLPPSLRINLREGTQANRP
ncbi:hypothetical protein FRC02_007083 [Tulasnella sp. 418]|nr:hypothetical protein FRC02_007083 [Tulasnella sp. 418]